MRKRKGQSALEYLVTYGWAILAIVIIAAVLWYLGIFDPTKWSSGKQSGGFSSVTVIDYTADSTAGVSVVFGNAVGHSITGMEMAVETSTAIACSPVTAGARDTFQCDDSNYTSVTTGDTLDLTLTYTDSMSGLDHTESGFVKVP